jgi:hypothetical protein
MADNKATSSATTFRMETAVAINIKASADKIMALLTNVSDFAKWNSTVISVDGQIKQGEKIKLVSKLDPKRTFNLKVSQLTPTTMVWQDGFAPMFSGVRTFLLTPKSDGTTDFSMVEVFKGLMLPMIKGSLPDFKPNFEQYALDLKTAAEKQ